MTTGPDGLTIGALDPAMTSTIGAKGALYSASVPKTSGLTVDAGDCANTFQAPDGDQVQVLIKAPAPRPAGAYNVPAYPMTPGQTVQSYLSDAITYATGANPDGTVYSSVVFPKATYTVEDFPGCDDARGQNGFNHWQIQNIADLVIDGQGSTLAFSGLCEGIEMDWAQRVVFKNFTLSWPDIQLAALGTVESVDPSSANPTMNIVVDSAYPVSADAVIESITAWDRASGAWSLEHPYDDEGMDPGHTTYLGGQTFQFGMFTPFQVGETVILRYFGGESTGLSINDSNDVTVDNVHVMNGTGTGFEFSLGRGFLLHNSSVERLPGALISIAGVAAYLPDDVGDIDVENNTFGYGGDDAIDLLANLWCSSTAAGTSAPPCNPFLAGATAGQVSSFNVFTWWDHVFTAGDTLGYFDAGLNFMTTGTVASTTTDSHVSTTLQFNTPSPALAEYVSDLTFSGPRYVIRNNTFLPNRARGLILQTPHGLIEGNTFRGQTMHSIYLDDSPLSAAGPGVQNLLIANNTITSVGNAVQPVDNPVFGAIVLGAEDLAGNTVSLHAPLHQNIVLANNTISNIPVPGIFVSTANNVILANNTLSNVNQASASPVRYGTATSNGAIVVTRADNVFLQGNTLSGTSGPPSIDTTSTSGIVTQ